MKVLRRTQAEAKRKVDAQRKAEAAAAAVTAAIEAEDGARNSLHSKKRLLANAERNVHDKRAELVKAEESVKAKMKEVTDAEEDLKKASEKVALRKQEYELEQKMAVARAHAPSSLVSEHLNTCTNARGRVLTADRARGCFVAEDGVLHWNSRLRRKASQAGERWQRRESYGSKASGRGQNSNIGWAVVNSSPRLCMCAGIRLLRRSFRG